MQIQQHAFYLRGEYVDSADDKHVVRPALGFRHANQGTAAFTGLMGYGSNIPGAVTDKRQGLFADTGKHQFALFPIRQLFPGDRIDNFRVEEIFLHVHACLFLTFAGHARACNLREAIDVKGPDGKS